MTKRMAWIFPGQGAQYPGMGKDFYEQFSVARQTFEEAEDCLKLPLSKLIFEGPSAELTLTSKAQVAIYITSIAILRALRSLFPEMKPSVCAGLSLGEYTALTASGKIGFADCLKLVLARGSYMQQACEVAPGTMSVVLGLEPTLIHDVVATLNPPHLVWVANLNCPGQVVIAGTKEGVEIASIALKEKGAKRCLPLEVSGAFHSGLMRSAQEQLAPAILSVPLQATEISLVMNVVGDYVSDLDQIRKCLIEQVVSSVLWEKGIRAIEEKGCDLYIEIGPGKTLAGMNKRIGVTSPTVNIETVADLESIGSLCNY